MMSVRLSARPSGVTVMDCDQINYLNFYYRVKVHVRVRVRDGVSSSSWRKDS